MSGIDSSTGAAIDEMAHIRQSIIDILRTRIGERIMRREYGSWLPYLVDAPMDPVTLIDIYASVVGAIRRWEPRVRVKQVQAAEVTSSGRLTIHIAVTNRRTGEPISLDGITI